MCELDNTKRSDLGQRLVMFLTELLTRVLRVCSLYYDYLIVQLTQVFSSSLAHKSAKLIEFLHVL